MITKLRTTLVDRECFECKRQIKKGEKYYDSDESVNKPKPFPKKKFCVECIKKKIQ